MNSELSFWRWSGQIGGWSATFSVWTRCNATQLQAMTCTLVNVHHGIVKPSLCPFTWRVLHRCDAHPLIALWMSVICRAECEWDSESNRCIFVWLPNKRSFYSPGWWCSLWIKDGKVHIQFHHHHQRQQKSFRQTEEGWCDTIDDRLGVVIRFDWIGSRAVDELGL